MKVNELTLETIARKIDEMVNFENSIRESMLQLHDRWTAIVKHHEQSIIGVSKRIDRVERMIETIKDLICQLQQTR